MLRRQQRSPFYVKVDEEDFVTGNIQRRSRGRGARFERTFAATSVGVLTCRTPNFIALLRTARTTSSIRHVVEKLVGSPPRRPRRWPATRYSFFFVYLDLIGVQPRPDEDGSVLLPTRTRRARRSSTPCSLGLVRRSLVAQVGDYLLQNFQTNKSVRSVYLFAEFIPAVPWPSRCTAGRVRPSHPHGSRRHRLR